MRLLCILLPHFPLRCEVLRQPGLDGYPAAVTHAVGSQRLVLDCSPGLEIDRDMPLQQALSLHSEIEVIHANMPYYWSVFNDILDRLELKSPLVEGFELGDIYVGLTGLELLYGSDDALASAIREAIPEVFDARLGIAEGKFLSRLAALNSPPSGYLALSGDFGLFLKDLPCDLLPVPARSKGRLHDFGLHTLGQLAAMPAARLQAQFGPEGQLIWELANGLDDTPLYPRLTAETIEESTSLGSPSVSLDLLLMALEAMVSRSLTRLGQRGMGISRLTLWTKNWLAEHWEQDVCFKEPAMTIGAALSRIRHIVESHPQTGPVEEIGLKVTGAARPTGRQRSLMTQVRAQEHLLEEIRQMELRLGGPQVFKVKEVEPWSRMPERRYALTPLSR